jgi:hypothetical protein
MSEALERRALKEVPKMIANWLESAPGQVRLHQQIKGHDIDLIQRTGGYTFLVHWKAAGTAALVRDAITSLRNRVPLLSGQAVPVVAVPYMGDVGRDLCAREGVSWLDLSGNAHIVAPGLRIHIEGKPNLFKGPGRPKNIFAPKSSRIARRLLIEPNRWFSQRELTKEAGVDEALVSRVVRGLEKDGLLVRNEAGAIKPGNPSHLLEAWREAYDFSKHRIIQGFIAERTSDAILQRLVHTFDRLRLDYAMTGLAAAWQLTHFASFRIVSVYLRESPSKDLIQLSGFKEQPRGGNVWLVVPNDEGVFDGASKGDNGVQHAHPVQVYLDLKGQPERAKEAADMVRQQYLTWGDHA